MTDNPEFVDLFQQLDGMVNAFDAEGAGPLRKGEHAFSWAVVETLALPLAEAVPDLRVGIWLLRAELAREGLPGLLRGMSRLATWMELPADELHPMPEPGEPPRELHALLLRWLTAPAFLSVVREAPVWPQATMSLGGLLESTEPAEVLAGLAACPTDQVLAALTETVAAVRRADQVLLLEAGDADVSLTLLGEILSRAQHRLSVSLTPEALPTDPTETPPGPLPSAAPALPRRQGTVNSREEVQAALVEIIQYFREHEPGHPAPIFLQRIQRMLGASFEDLLQELFPDASQLVAKLERPASN